jgi:short-subunit dehydrogenase
MIFFAALWTKQSRMGDSHEFQRKIRPLGVGYRRLWRHRLHVELKRFGVDVTVLSPGLTRTSMSEGLPLDLGKLPIRSESAAAVARFGVSRLGRTASAAPGILNNMFIFFNRLSPRILPVALFGFLVRRAFRRDARGSLLIGPQ